VKDPPQTAAKKKTVSTTGTDIKSDDESLPSPDNRFKARFTYFRENINSVLVNVARKEI
jgi:ribulose 1,5-bisphosphate carboxylase large subunit-like protein